METTGIPRFSQEDIKRQGRNRYLFKLQRRSKSLGRLKKVWEYGSMGVWEYFVHAPTLSRLMRDGASVRSGEKADGSVEELSLSNYFMTLEKEIHQKVF